MMGTYIHTAERVMVLERYVVKVGGIMPAPRMLAHDVQLLGPTTREDGQQIVLAISLDSLLLDDGELI